MAQYVFEIVKGEQHLYVCKGNAVVLHNPAMPLERLKPIIRTCLDPKPRNALRIDGYREAKGFLESMMSLSHDAFRKLADVDKTWDNPIRINLRRDSPNHGVLDTPSLQRMYVFKEQV